MSVSILPLKEVIYDKRARDGTWCTMQYEGHKKGCPNFPDCIEKYDDFQSFPKETRWYAVILPFDLKAHEEEYLKKDWCKTRKQARCVLYWQKSHVNRLFKMTHDFADKVDADFVLPVPEANGVHVYKTLQKCAWHLKPVNMDLDIVYKVMLVGKIGK